MSAETQLPLATFVDRYVAHQRVLGKCFDTPAYVLSRVVRYVRAAGASDLDAVLFDGWSQSGGTSMNARRAAQNIVHKFCRYRRRLDPDCFLPDRTRFARRTQGRAPVIFGSPEVVRMLKFVSMLPGCVHYPLSARGLRLIIILLYTTGMRRGEVERLALSDISLKEGTVRIRDSKFHKSRTIPLSTSVIKEVRSYLTLRLVAPWDIGPEARLFGHQHGYEQFRGYSGGGMHGLVSTAIAAAKIVDADGRPAHIHDFRHSFAVQALLRWYAQGVDVGAKLPQLSMYMGHVSIASTAHYLHFVPQIARAASRRFHREFGDLVRGVS